jgi:hypothetical protein
MMPGDVARTAAAKATTENEKNELSKGVGRGEQATEIEIEVLMDG